MAFEGVEPARPPAKPARRRVIVRRFAITRKIDADVVEHPVQQHPQTAPSRFSDQVVEIVVVAKSRIDPVMVGGVVAMSA